MPSGGSVGVPALVGFIPAKAGTPTGDQILAAFFLSTLPTSPRIPVFCGAKSVWFPSLIFGIIPALQGQSLEQATSWRSLNHPKLKRLAKHLPRPRRHAVVGTGEHRCC